MIIACFKPRKQERKKHSCNFSMKNVTLGKWKWTKLIGQIPERQKH